MAHKPTYPVTRAAFGVAALVAIVILANWLISLTPLGNRGHDFTENKNHTLSDGTKAILKNLDTPVVIRYYASRSTNYMPEQLKLHMRRVDDVLKEYASLSGGRLRIENLDPEPDTDAEDSANLDGIRGQRIDNENLYFGLAVNCLDRTAVIPVLEPRNETMLEYNLSKAIDEVTTPTKPVIGIMSALDLKGAPAQMQGQRPSQPWVIYQQLKRSFDVKDLGMVPEALDPKEIKVLLLFHPAGITPEVEFMVDQYLLGGGTVVAVVDAFSIAAQMAGGGNPMMGMGGGVPTTSTLPTLFGAWGVSFESGQTLADPAYKTMVNTRNGAADSITVLTLPQVAMPQKDNVITKDLSSIIMWMPGGFTKTRGGGVDINTLVRSTTTAGFVDSMRASRLDPTLAMTLKPTGTAYDLVSHLHGTFKTAFPDGKPGEVTEPEPEEKKPEIGQLPAEVKKPDPKPVWLKAGTAPGNVFLIADVDAFSDQFAYDPRMLQMQMASPTNGNVSLLFNLLDQATGSKYLIGSRSRAAVRRPFLVIKEMENKLEKDVGEERAKYLAEEAETERELLELQAKRNDSNNPYATPEQEARIKELNKTKVKIAKKLREMEKGLRRQKDSLTGRITLANVVVMPALVILIGLGLYIARRSATRAR